MSTMRTIEIDFDIHQMIEYGDSGGVEKGVISCALSWLIQLRRIFQKLAVTG